MNTTTRKASKFQLPIKQKLSYGVGHILNDLCASMWFSYMLLYTHKVAGLNSVNAGLLVLVGQIADALSTPLVGIGSDRITNVRYGRRKIWHLFGVVCVATSFPFIFSLCIYNCAHATQAELMMYYIPFIVIFQFGWASTQISHLSLIPELTNCKQGKVELNAIRYFFTVLANLLVFAVCYLLFELNAGETGSNDAVVSFSVGDAPKFQYLAICVVAVGLIFMVIFHVCVKEKRIQPISHTLGSDKKELLIKKDDISTEHYCQKTNKDWFKTPLFYQVGWLYMMTRLIVNISQVYISYFVLDALHLPKSSIAIAPAVIYVSGMLASLVAKNLNAKVGLKLTFFICLVFILASSVWFYISHNLSQSYKFKVCEVYGAAALLGMGSSTLLIDSLAMISEMIGTNTDTSAFVYGSMSFLDKVSNGIAIILIQYYHPCKSDPICCLSCQQYYGQVMVFVPGGAAVLALIVLITLINRQISTSQEFVIQPVSSTMIKKLYLYLVKLHTSH